VVKVRVTERPAPLVLAGVLLRDRRLYIRGTCFSEEEIHRLENQFRLSFALEFARGEQHTMVNLGQRGHNLVNNSFIAEWLYRSTPGGGSA